MRGFVCLLWFALVAAGLWMLAQWMQLPLAPNLDAAIGIATLLWLFFIVTVPWNMYFQAHQILFEAQTSRERGVKVDEGAVAYATRWARIARMIAVGLHLATAIALCAVAISGVGLIGWFGAGAAIVLTFARPGLRAYSHVRNRLSRIGSELQVPPEDAHELRRRLTAVEDQLQQLARALDAANPEGFAGATQLRLSHLEQSSTEHGDRHTELAEFLRLEVVRVEREARNTVAQVLGDAAVVGHVRELVRFFKQA